MQTCTVTVAVLPEVSETQVKVDPADLEWKYTLASGKGGQNVQKNLTAVQLFHRPSGIHLRCENERSQYQNKLWALEMLRSKLVAQERTTGQQGRNVDRKQQVGSGQRGDKIRTIRTQDNQVSDERTGAVKTFRQYAAGDLSFG